MARARLEDRHKSQPRTQMAATDRPIRTQVPSRPLAIGYGIIIGGALGNNLVDRVIYGRVADFFHFYGFGYDWYVFNIADVAITLGAVAILYDVLRPQMPHTVGQNAGQQDSGHEV
jgi:lipoprotein signal peptidase